MSAWFSCWAPKPHTPVRLFCFPHAGAGASVFFGWSRALAHSPIEVRAAHLPGRESRLKEPLRRSIPDIVEQLQGDLAPLLDRPYALFGHSMGAIVAFELARAQQVAGNPAPTHLFVSGAGAPQAVSRERLHELSDPEFLRAMTERYQGIPADVLAHPDLVAMILPALRADIEAIETYEYRGSELGPLNCAITALAGQSDRHVTTAGLDRWHELTRGTFDRQTFPGDHFYLESARAHLLKAVGSAILRPDLLTGGRDDGKRS